LKLVKELGVTKLKRSEKIHEDFDWQ